MCSHALAISLGSLYYTPVFDHFSLETNARPISGSRHGFQFIGFGCFICAAQRAAVSQQSASQMATGS